MAKLMEIEDWQEVIVDEVAQAIENGDIIYDDDELEEIIADFVTTKFEQEEIDETMRDELFQYVDELADIIRENYYLDNDEDYDEDEF